MDPTKGQAGRDVSQLLIYRPDLDGLRAFAALLDRETFSLWKFYSRRIRRIFPALLAVLAVVLIFGWFALLPKEYRALGKHVFGVAAFISNFLFWREAGYFDAARP